MRDQRLWTWHVLAGLVIFVFLGLHMAVMHLDTLLGWFTPAGVKPIAWESVAQRARLGFFAASYVVLLGAALFHGLYGLRNILFELGLGGGAKKGLSLVLAIGGVALFAYGAWAAMAAFGALPRPL
jgi:succinate dehydrogenase / fumarate reductase membrane anchor subunit